MTDWEHVEKIGRDLQSDFLEYFRKAREGLPEKLADQRARLDQMNPLGAAIRRQYEGDEGALAEYVRTYRLSSDDQLQLGEFHDRKLAPPKQKGHPPSNALGAAQVAENFYNEWRKANERAGVNDHGHREQMREEAVRFICVDFLSRNYGVSGEKQREKVLQNMKRPRSRRKVRH